MINPILVPNSALPKKDPVKPCPCQDKPVKLAYKTGTLIWLKDIGDFVHKDEVICEGEVEKKALEFLSPSDGYLIKKCLNDDDEFSYGDILGYIRTEDSDNTEVGT